MKKSRIIALILCVAMMVTMFAGCGKETVMKIDGKSIPVGLYTYYYSYLYAQYASYGVEDTEIREAALNQLKQIIAVEELAKQLDVEFTPTENKAIIDTRNASIESMGRAAYAEMLKAFDLTEKQYERIDKNYYLYSKIYTLLYGEGGLEVPATEDMREEYKNNYIRASHILLSTEEAEDDAARAEIKKNAEAVLAKAQAGEDFVELIKEYGEDPGLKENPEEGYYFTSGQMVAEFEAAAFALEENAISDLVETSYGYHIIKRLPVSDEHIDAAVSEETYYTTYCQQLLGEKLMGIAEDYTVEYTDAYSTIDFTDAIYYWLGY